jgi:hypothetical protein
VLVFDLSDAFDMDKALNQGFEIYRWGLDDE